MSIIANFINNIQDLTFSNVILSLNNQINSLDEISRSPLYEYFKLDKEAIKVPIVSSPSLNYKEILSNGNFKHSKAYLKPNFPNPNQLCPKCNSTKEWHYIHTKTQKRCKLCLKTFIFSEPNKFNTSILSNKSLKFYCPYRIKAKNEIIKEHGKLNPT